MTEFDMSDEELEAWQKRMEEFFGTHHSACGDIFFTLARFVEDYKTLKSVVLND